MIEITYDNNFKKLFKKWKKRHPDIVDIFQNKLKQFAANPFNPALKTHSLSGILAGSWAFSITYNQRVVFIFVNGKKTKVILVDIGAHDEVY